MSDKTENPLTKALGDIANLKPSKPRGPSELAASDGSVATERLRYELKKAGTFSVTWGLDETRVHFNTPNHRELYRALLAFAEETALPPNVEVSDGAGKKQ